MCAINSYNSGLRAPRLRSAGVGTRALHYKGRRRPAQNEHRRVAVANVLAGDVAGRPRPVIPGETELVELRRRLGVYSVRPGITGLAQVRGRDCISVRRKAELDAEYTRRMSFWLDIALLLRTFFCVIFCRDVHEGK